VTGVKPQNVGHGAPSKTARSPWPRARSTPERAGADPAGKALAPVHPHDMVIHGGLYDGGRESPGEQAHWATAAGCTSPSTCWRRYRTSKRGPSRRPSWAVRCRARCSRRAAALSHPRCPAATDHCRREVPRLIKLPTGQMTACHHPHPEATYPIRHSAPAGNSGAERR